MTLEQAENGKERLVIASYVNKICEASPEDISDSLINQAHMVISYLDERMNTEKTTITKAGFVSEGKSKQKKIIGNTQFGNFETMVPQDKKSNIGIDNREPGFRIGNYVVRKTIVNKHGIMYFEYFWNNSIESQVVFERFSPITCLTYTKEPIEVEGLLKLVPKIFKLGTFFVRVHYSTHVFWGEDNWGIHRNLISFVF